MARAERLVSSQERIYLVTREHGVVLLRPFLRSALAVVLFGGAAFELAGAPVPSVVRWAGALVAAAVVSISMLGLMRRVGRWNARKLVVTDRRVLLTSGTLSRRVAAIPLDDLGVPPVLTSLAMEPRGLVLVTGPTGSGKTTTLAGMIDHINNNREVHVVTIEDPIEVLHFDKLSMINQREVRVDTSDFSTALRAAMRQDPDVILVGEMRDTETVKAALAAAETGHFVMSTLHTTDAAETINRVIDFFPPHEQKQVRLSLAGALRGIICQRLVQRADGLGRCVAMEIAINTGRVADAITDPDKTSTIGQLIGEGAYYGMQTFDAHLVALIRDGIISLEAAMSASTSPHDLTVELRRLGLVA